MLIKAVPVKQIRRKIPLHRAERRAPAQRYERGLKAYRARHVDDAVGAFAVCLKFNPEDGPSRLFIQRLEKLEGQGLAAPWDDVWTMAEK
ncbi:MAG: hypothetical protein LH481_16600 [Burkholderiales bacterium]|nr:hypothetical protein [Burkholderiales bacterium]